MMWHKNTMKQAVLAAALALAAAGGPAWARDSALVNETRPLAADGVLSVNNMAGSITVQGWDRNEVAITGTLGADVEKLEISGDGRTLGVNVRYPSRMHGSVDETHLELRVPARARLQLEAVSADIIGSGVSGAIAARSVSGDVRLDVGSGEIDASTVSGDLHVTAPSFKTTLNSVSGDLVANGVRGSLKAETVSGDINLALALDEGAKLNAETLSGDIDLRLPKAPNAQLTMKTFSGDLRNGFGSDRDDDGEVRKVSTTFGAGRGNIDLHTFSGDIRIGPQR